MKSVLLSSLSILLVSSQVAIAQETSIAKPSSAPEVIAETSESNLIASGSFVTTEQDHPTSGMATVVEENGQRYLVFDDNFTTAEGPDVQVVLHRNSPVPVQLDEENYVTIAPLQSTDGKQRYVLPEDINLEAFQAVSIWCRQFNVSFGYAAFE